MEESKAELDFLVKEAYWLWQLHQTEEHQMLYDILQERLIAWKQKHRGTHLKWITEKEALGHETHQWVLAHGPKHPNSYLHRTANLFCIITETPPAPSQAALQLTCMLLFDTSSAFPTLPLAGPAPQIRTLNP
jgi:hypothetical protein